MAESLFSKSKKRLEEPLRHVNLSPDAVERLKFPKASLRVAIPVRMDNGDLKVFPGYRVRYDDTRGPTKGGIRLFKLGDVERLAAERAARARNPK